jgi:hypothetical protein
MKRVELSQDGSQWVISVAEEVEAGGESRKLYELWRGTAFPEDVVLRAEQLAMWLGHFWGVVDSSGKYRAMDVLGAKMAAKFIQSHSGFFVG